MSIDVNHKIIFCNKSQGVNETFLSKQTVLSYLKIFRAGFSFSMWTEAMKYEYMKLLYNTRVFYVLLLGNSFW